MHRIGIRGRGVGSRLHQPIWTAVPGTEVVYVSPHEVAKFREQWDCWIVAVPPQAHVSEFELAPRDAAVIILEKPCGASLADSQELDRRSNGRQVVVNYQLRFDETIRDARRYIVGNRARTLWIRYRSTSHLLRSPSVRIPTALFVLPHILDFLTWFGIDCTIGPVITAGLGLRFSVSLTGESAWSSVDIHIEIDHCNVREGFDIVVDDSECFDVLKPYRNGQTNLLRSHGEGPWRGAYRRLCTSVRESWVGGEQLSTDFATPASSAHVWRVLDRVTTSLDRKDEA